jgi:chitinase
VAQAATVYFYAGQTTATITIDVKGDRTKEANETFFINLSGSTGATIADSQAKGTITNDDGAIPAPSLPKLQIDDASVSEGASGTKVMEFTVTLSAPSTEVVRVNFTTKDDTAKISNNDYVSLSGILEFLPGQTAKKIAVVINGDRTKESDESFYVLLSSAVGAEIATPQGRGRILNDDR